MAAPLTAEGRGKHGENKKAPLPGAPSEEAGRGRSAAGEADACLPAAPGGRTDKGRQGTAAKTPQRFTLPPAHPARCRACCVHPDAGSPVSRESVVAAAAVAKDDGGQHEDPGAAVVVKQSAEAVVHSIYLSLLAPSGHRHLRPAVRFFPHSMSAYAKGAIPCGLRRVTVRRCRRAVPWNSAASAKIPWRYQSPAFSDGCSWPRSR